MTAQSKAPNVPDERNFVELVSEVEKHVRELKETGEAARDVSDALLRRTKKEALELQIYMAATEVSIFKRDASDAGARRLADKQRELAELREQLKREFPENERRWWHALPFWWKSAKEVL